MSFNNETNNKRVTKIVETLQLIHKSGAANEIDREDMWNMLEPVINQVGEMIGEDPQKPEPEEEKPVRRNTTSRTPRWADVRQMAQEAPLQDLSVALAVFLSRFDELESIS